MKRSEMIAKLMEPIKIGDVDLHLYKSEAEAVLLVVERAGMCPPDNTQGLDYGPAEWDAE